MVEGYNLVSQRYIVNVQRRNGIVLLVDQMRRIHPIGLNREGELWSVLFVKLKCNHRARALSHVSSYGGMRGTQTSNPQNETGAKVGWESTQPIKIWNQTSSALTPTQAFGFTEGTA